MNKSKVAVIAFPGNNCERETARAAERNGFSAEIIRWNQTKKVGNYDFYVLPGGFSFEDRGRSGALSAREPIFDAIRNEAKKGKIILGICNGAQMIVESGLIPVGKNPLPFSLAHNIRRDTSGHVVGTGFYNTWVHLKPERTDTAFTQNIDSVLHVPIAHGEGRFASEDPTAIEVLKNGKNVAFRYCDDTGNIDEHFPVTPNGALSATAAIVNEEGTVMAIMPHPERFFESFDGDQIFQSVKQWIDDKKSPTSVKIGDFGTLKLPEVKNYESKPGHIILEKKLIITDNEAFSVSQTASHVTGENINLEKTVYFEVKGEGINLEKLKDSGLFYNASKEILLEKPSGNRFGVKEFQNDEADHLAEQLAEKFKTECQVTMMKVWDFGDLDSAVVEKVLQNRLLANPNASEIFKMS